MLTIHAPGYAKRGLLQDGSLGSETLVWRRLRDETLYVESLRSQGVDVNRFGLALIDEALVAKAYALLADIGNLIVNTPDSGKSSQTFRNNVTSLTKAFYNTVPHTDDAKLLQTVDDVSEKTKLIEELAAIRYAVSSSKEPYPPEGPSKRILRHAEPEEFELIAAAVQETHSRQHTQLKKMRVLKVLDCTWPPEIDRFKAKNYEGVERRLLWHGSRLANWVSILEQGLKIAPPEAPATGYMFGKGVYFTDMASKAATYCRNSYASPIGYLVLAEVALGPPYKTLGFDYYAPQVCQEKGYLHTWGVGQSCPGEMEMVPSVIDEEPIPLSRGTEQRNATWTDMQQEREKEIQAKSWFPRLIANFFGYYPSLSFNEFVVYDEAQVVLRYLVEVEFF